MASEERPYHLGWLRVASWQIGFERRLVHFVAFDSGVSQTGPELYPLIWLLLERPSSVVPSAHPTTIQLVDILYRDFIDSDLLR